MKKESNKQEYFTFPEKETLSIEFKSDRKGLSDDDLVEAVICLANSSGGTLYLGIEDDGILTGIQDRHNDPSGIVSLIGNKTVPPLQVHVKVLIKDEVQIMVIEIPKSYSIISTTKGVTVRRRIKFDGTPECVPFFPHEFIQRESDLGHLDYSSFPIKNSSMQDLDTIEIQRLRQFIEQNSKEQYLVSLSEEELLKALELIKEHEHVITPSLAGLLLVGKEESIHKFIPSHEVSFQVLKGTNVKINEFFRCSLIKLIERIETLFQSQIVEDEIQTGMFRQSIPNYDFRAFREAFINSLVHRDYSKMGTVAIQMDDLGLTISNPGGFIEGVTLQNILRVQPMPRNRSLADSVKRIGLAERTGRGIDLIYYGLLKFGRTYPDYSDTTNQQVEIHISKQNPDIAFIELINQIEKKLKQNLPLDYLIIIYTVYHQNKLGIADLMKVIQRNEIQTRQVVDSMLEKELLDEVGLRQNQQYSLNKNLVIENKKGFKDSKPKKMEKKQIENKILRVFEDRNFKLTKAQVLDLCQISSDQAAYVLKKMVQEKLLKLIQQGPKSYYIKVK